MWCPPSSILNRLRAQVESDLDSMKAVLSNKSLVEQFGDGEANMIKSAREHILKTCPKGYKSDHPQIQLLRLKSWIISKSFTDEQVLGEGALAQKVMDALATLVPFVNLLNDWAQT